MELHPDELAMNQNTWIRGQAENAALNPVISLQTEITEYCIVLGLKGIALYSNPKNIYKL